MPYVAKLKTNANKLEEKKKGGGEWIELSYGKNGLDKTKGFSSQANVFMDTRLVASLVGVTPLDRPEWIAIDSKRRNGVCRLNQQDKTHNR